MADLSFLDSFNKEVSKMEGIGTSSAPPRYWYSCGNYVLNRIISGSFYKCVPQGRVVNFAGPSGSGKSFILCNLMREAQQAGAFVLVIDTENALDDDFVGKIGVKTTPDCYKYLGVTTVAQAITVVSAFLKSYKKEHGNAHDAPQIMIVVDSLDMLMTETELENYGKGVQKGDQGQRNKQLKAMLRSWVQDIKELNVIIACASQVYKNQDVTNGEGVWIVSDAVKYSASLIGLITKLKLKDTASSAVTGIRMKVEGYKTRFTKPFQTVTVEVPYEQGMDPYSGLKEAALGLGVLQKAGSYLYITGEQDKKWYERDIEKHAHRILLAAEKQANAFLRANLEDGEEEHETESKQQLAQRRIDNLNVEKAVEAMQKSAEVDMAVDAMIESFDE